MRKIITIVAAFSMAAVGLAGNLSAQSSLKDEPTVRDGIIYVGMAYEISRKCDSLSPRTFRGLNYLQTLKNEARQLGYSEDEIATYIDDDAEKDRLEGLARAQLTRLGVVEGEGATYCTAGRAQIAENTRVGWLLR